MNVENFKREFSDFWAKFIKTHYNPSLHHVTRGLMGLEIIQAINEELHLKLDLSSVTRIYPDVKTPASGIVMVTPNAPDIQKVHHEQNSGMSGRFRSLDTLTSERLKNSPVDDLILPEPGALTPKDENNVDGVTTVASDAQGEEKKYLSKSNPSVKSLVRSETYVCENEFESVKNGDVVEENNVEVFLPNDVDSENAITEADFTALLKKLTAFRDSANDIINNIGDLLNADPENKTRPIRRLSAIGHFPGLNRNPTASKTTQRSKMNRRSLAAFPGTPTSSRLIPGNSEKNDDSMRRKSASALSLVNFDGSKLSIPSTYRSVSSGAIVIPKKSPKNLSVPSGSRLSGIKPPKTPAIRSTSLSIINIPNKTAGRQSKNSKYAHVQSTIPKAGGTPGKR